MSTRLSLLILVLTTPYLGAQEKKPDAEILQASTFRGFKLRSIGPATTGGRIAAFAVHPTDPSHYYAAVASGGVWKTTNAGTTWTPVFDDQSAYSIGAIAIDAKNPNVVWVGTGENNSQRSVSYGTGVFLSRDGGNSWNNMGLKRSEHIGKILIDPRDSDVVYVAAQGPLWGPGGDRGLFQTTDGGESWQNILSISENTGVSDVVQHPRNPDVLLASAYQRRRHVWTLINGGPESAVYKSTDGGKSWRKITQGLPKTELGRIGLAFAPSDPNVAYALVESIDNKGGIYRSLDQGETWEKRNSFDEQGQYYGEIFVDPGDRDRIYVPNTFTMVSNDGGKTLERLGHRWMHVDTHAFWIDPANTNYYRAGCDGGVYETFDRGKSWRFINNLPITQFYDITVDDQAPFYHVYGGTQDNFTLGGAAKTRSVHGILNEDWFVTKGGDGFQCKVDPTDPNIVYCESQYGVLARFDRRTGQRVSLQPQPGKGEPPLRWNWDSPLVLSPHSHTRLYFAANKVFRSDDRGDSWTAISGDLTRQLDRDRLEVMGRIWPLDTVAKHLSTSVYGNVVALTESPKQEGLLFAGTDDGLIQVTEDAGKNWTKIEDIPGVPRLAYVARLFASRHDPNLVYAAFDNHKNNDFKPYLFKSADRGKTWKSIGGNLPENGPVLAFVEDHVKPELLFVGTEFGLFFTLDGGSRWTQLKNGLPTISVRDLAIQKQENDLVLGTFGRGFYVLDDYAPLREITPTLLEQPSALLPVRRALLYVETRKYGGRGKGFQGANFFTAENPPFGATFTYYLKETIKTNKETRREKEQAALKNRKDPTFPTDEQLHKESMEESPLILLTIRDRDNRVVRVLQQPATKGIHRVTWDLREPTAVLPRATEEENESSDPPGGILVAPGKYTVTLSKRVDGMESPLEGKQEFEVVHYLVEGEQPSDQQARYEYQKKIGQLERAILGASKSAEELRDRLVEMKRAIDHTPNIDGKWKRAIRELIQEHAETIRALQGDRVLESYHKPTPPSIVERLRYATGDQQLSLSLPTKSQRESLRIAEEEFVELLSKMRKRMEVDVKAIEKAMDEAGSPWTPGRLPSWKSE